MEREKKWMQDAVPESHEGQFTAKAKKAGMTVQQFAAHVHANPGKFSAKTRKQAAFAKTAKKIADRD